MARPKLYAAMRAKGYSHGTFAKAMQVSKATVHRWVSGDTDVIWNEFVPGICDKLDLRPEDLDNEPTILNVDECEAIEESEVQYCDREEESEEHMELSRRDAAFGALKAAGFSFIPGTAILAPPPYRTR